MLTIIKWLILTVYNILPDSPFAVMVEEMELNQNFLQYLNWFLPLDIVGNMMLAWLGCIIAYFIYKLVMQIVKIIVKLYLTSKNILGFFASLFMG